MSSRSQAFADDLRGACLRKKIGKKRKTSSVKPVKVAEGQRLLLPKRMLSAYEFRREEIYKRNKALSEEAAKIDMDSHMRRASK